MKTTIAILLLCAGTAFAQNGDERVNVPLSDATRPARVQVHLLMGGIIVRGGGNTKDVVVEYRGRAGADRQPPVPPQAAGMHRLDIPGAGLNIVEENNLVSIKTTAWNRHGDVVVTVPHHCSLQLKSINDGDISVEQVEGEIDADALNGRISLKDVGGSVLAHSLNGAIFATLTQVDPSKPISFSTLNGDIDVTLPRNVKANVRMKTDNGEIYSDFDVKLGSGSQITASDSGDRQKGAYRFRQDRTLRGTINGGGPEYQFTSFNGQIFIREKK